MSRLFTFLMFWLIIPGGVIAQNNECEQTLNFASAEFEAGRFYGLPNILKPCLEKGFSTEQKVRAYLLLTQAHLIMDDAASAEDSYLKLLKANPEYIATTRDPIDVYYLSKKFTATPIFTPHVRIGLNTSLIRTIYGLNSNSVSDPNASHKTFKIGYQIGGGIDWNLNDRWSICLGFGYAKKVLKSTLHNYPGGSQGTFTEKQDWFDIPLYLKYSVDSGKIRPFAYAGIAANLLFNSKLAPEGVDFNSPDPGGQQVSQAPDQSITSMRNFFNRSLVFGGGAKYKVGKNFFYVDVRYMAGLSNVVKNTGFNPLMTQFPELQSDFFRVDNLSVSFGYVKPLYDPRKKKKAVASLLEKLGIKRSKK